MFCTNCGQRVDDGQRYCTSCGAPMYPTGNNAVSQMTQPVVPVMPDNASVGPVAAKKSKAPIIMTALISLVVIAAAAAVVFFAVRPFEGTAQMSPSGNGSATTTNIQASQGSSINSSSSDSTSSSGSSSASEASKSSQAPKEPEPEFIGITGANATSFLPTQGINSSNYSPASVIDGQKSTCWAEGASGSGIGESITLFGTGEQLFSGFTIRNGYQKSNDIYYKNNRPKVINVLVNGELVDVVDLKDSGLEAQTFWFAEPVVGKEITFQIEDVYSGSRYSDCCISEIDVF